jgi:hypothetical protein
LKISGCMICGKKMKAGLTKRYCSDVCTLRSYREHEIESAIACAYCGSPADSIDHIPPRSVRPTLLASGLARRYPFIEVDSCRECNSLLGARSLWTLKDRRQHIKQKLKSRYAKYLRIPNWSPTELAAMGQNSPMRKHIENGLLIRDFTLKRIQF